MITVSLEPKWRHFAQVNIADIFMLSSKLPKQNEKKLDNSLNSRELIIQFKHIFQFPEFETKKRPVTPQFQTLKDAILNRTAMKEVNQCPCAWDANSAAAALRSPSDPSTRQSMLASLILSRLGFKCDGKINCSFMYACMDAMDAWMHGCIDAWMHGCMDAWMHGCMDAWMHACMDAWMHGCMDAWMHVCMYAWMHGCMDAWMHGCMDAWMHGCMDAWMHGCMDAWMHVCMDACMHVCMDA